MNNLDKEYTAGSIHSEKGCWHGIMSQFKDANLYQTLPYDAVRFGSAGVEHIIIKRRNVVVAAAQVRIYRLPRLKIGVAYGMWAPLWRPENAPEDRETFRQTIRAMRKEFSFNRSLVLRLYPLAYRIQDEGLEAIFKEEGYHLHDDEKIKRTLIIDLKPSLKELRAGLDQKWRNCLNRSEKNGLELISGEEEELFNEITKIYLEMVSRKRLGEVSDISHLKMVQRDLPPELKLKIILCRLNGEVCAGGIFSAIGNTGVYLIGATSDLGLKTKASYIVQWSFLIYLKEHGFRYYDLNGINPVSNPGTYHFKRGLAGKAGFEVELLGKFQVADSLVSSSFVKVGEWLLSIYRRMTQARKYLRKKSNKESQA
jgi:hypothetical protein